MRLILLTASVLFVSVTAGFAQSSSRFEVGPVVRIEKVSIEGGASGTTPVAGVAAKAMISRRFGVEAELTRASNPIERSYEGRFVSYVQSPNPSRDEIERMAPVARRSLAYAPGTGFAAAFVARTDPSQRVSLGGRIGAAGRKYVATTRHTILSIPEGIDPARVARDFQDSASHRTRGGLLFGIDASIALTRSLSVTPEVRFVYSGPARIGNKHRELGLGVRGAWRF